MASSRWGSVCAGAAAFTSGAALAIASPVVLPLAAIAGAVSKANGGSFSDGAGEVFSPVEDKMNQFLEAAEQFGDDNADELTKGATFVGKSVTAGAITAMTGKAFGGGIAKR